MDLLERAHRSRGTGDNPAANLRSLSLPALRRGRGVAQGSDSEPAAQLSPRISACDVPSTATWPAHSLLPSRQPAPAPKPRLFWRFSPPAVRSRPDALSVLLR